MNVNKILFFSLLATSSVLAQSPCIDGVWYEKNGLAVVEMENQKNLNGWSVENITKGATGNGYIIWKGSEFFNATGNGKLNYKIFISTPGKYIFDWRVSVNMGSSTTEHNDSWLSITDVDNFWAEKAGATPSLVKPKPACNNNPVYSCPSGSTLNNYFKIYGGLVNTFDWRAFTYDNDPHIIYFEKNTPGIININVDARSSFQAIDRLVVYRSPQVSQSTARNLANNQNDYLCQIITSTETQIGKNLKVFPNPTNGILKIEASSEGKYDILDSQGKLYKSNQNIVTGSNSVDVSYLNGGIYFINISTDDDKKTLKFIIEK